ncbi:MAG: glycine--tRNA ligase subunit beta [Mailhella sp.]|nr:glycine--tRNA ligase subunit beta [Mailhella sp.]
MSRFLLEIVTEELPSRFLAGTEQELVMRFTEALKENDLSFESVEAHCTPRHSVVAIEGLPQAQPLREETVTGPAVRVAFDADGNPTKAAVGFAAGQGTDVSALFRVETPKGEYVAVKKHSGGLSAAEVLRSVCPGIIAALPFPKRMRWGNGAFAFARPIHRINALLDADVVSFSVGDIESGRTTDGHRIHGAGPWNIPDAQSFEKVMREKAQVTLNSAERRKIIMQKGTEAALPCKILWKESLLDEVLGLAEHPVPVLGSFDKAYLELPREVLLTSMEVHQKCFGVENADGQLEAKFLTVLNIAPEDPVIVRKGWERVLRARLEDARFYWNTDLKDGFGTWAPMLDKVIFLGPLGSMGDKCRRLEQLCAWIADELGADEENAGLAGRLAKADLVSQMVGEFDTLQGIMGGIYGRKAGLPEQVCTALSEQYLPSGPETPIPSSELGAILSMADKADTLVGCFGLANIPTGAADPFALRRAALGIIRILREYGWELSVEKLFAKAHSLYPAGIRWKLDRGNALGKLAEFVRGRMKGYFASDANALFVEAVLAAGFDNIPSAAKRLESLVAAEKESSFAATAQTFKRVANILKKQDEAFDGAWKRDMLEEPAEKILADAVSGFAERFDAAWEDKNYAGIISLIENIRPSVDAFFDGVMVMAEDRSLRTNRLNLLADLMNRMQRLADFSQLQM